MIGCLWTRVRKQPIIALCLESENEPRGLDRKTFVLIWTQMFDTLIVFLKELFDKGCFEKKVSR